MIDSQDTFVPSLERLYDEFMTNHGNQFSNKQKLNNDINEDQIITWKDVDYSLDDPTVAYRRSMEKNFRSLLD